MPTRLTPITRLQSSAFLLSLGRALVSPLLVLTLSRQLQLAAAGIGLLLSLAMLSATLFGLYAGYLVDRFERRRLLLIATLMVATGFALLPFSQRWPLALLALLLVEAAMALFGIAVKALLGAWLSPVERGKAFALRYTLSNVSFAVGPWLGSMLAERAAMLPFWLAAGLALVNLALLTGLPPASGNAPDGAPVRQRFGDTLALLRRDRTLVLFTIGSLLACVVHGRFSDYLSMYLLQGKSDAEVLHWMSALIGTNALTVILLQYPLGRLQQSEQLLGWIMAGSALLAVGPAGFALADGLFAWCAAMVVFTLGEIIIVPAEYLFIDTIAPEAHKGSYYGAQQLANLGNAISPVLSGLVLAQLPPVSLLWLMLVLTVLGAGFVWAAVPARALMLSRGVKG
ncbi:MFS transporter [Neisseriaceae bacterium JH1-16]|nr:MFS transporter [Neisseriaceae bacterium JH1-16]